MQMLILSVCAESVSIASGMSSSYWNEWRNENPDMNPDLGGEDLHAANLSGADLRLANLSGADLSQADLSGAQPNTRLIAGRHLECSEYGDDHETRA
jgi:pentapeptide repeat protein